MENYDRLFETHLNQLKEEINAYKDEKSLWETTGDVKNPPGTLVLHICGNLKHNIGAVIGNTGYIRKRDEEFSKRDIAKAALIKEIDLTADMILPVLRNLTEEDLHNKFGSDHFDKEYNNPDNGWVLARLGFHFGYHLGQMNYMRRILEV